MARKPKSGAPRVVTLSSEASRDRLNIYIHTVQKWGKTQADDYRTFLKQTMQSLADNPSIALGVPEFPGVRRCTARWHNARDGHYIFFEETEQGILVIRILHTSMNRHEHLE